MQTIPANWRAPSNVHALTTVRQGGLSKPPFDSLNLGDHVGDNELAVIKNRELITAQFNLPSDPLWLTQTHSTRIFIQEEAILATPFDNEADGIFCTGARQVGVVMTADCMPLFLTNIDGTKIAALHAGWKGMADGIIEKGVMLFDQPAEQILAYAGPCISRQHFEVGLEVRDQLGGSNLAYSAHADSSKCYADLYALAGERLTAIGVRNYSHHPYCTFADEELFFSYRRDGQCGRMASLIWMD